MKKVEMSEEAILRRLKRVDQLRELSQNRTQRNKTRRAEIAEKYFSGYVFYVSMWFKINHIET